MPTLAAISLGRARGAAEGVGNDGVAGGAGGSRAQAGLPQAALARHPPTPEFHAVLGANEEVWRQHRLGHHSRVESAGQQRARARARGGHQSAAGKGEAPSARADGVARRVLVSAPGSCSHTLCSPGGDAELCARVQSQHAAVAAVVVVQHQAGRQSLGGLRGLGPAVSKPPPVNTRAGQGSCSRRVLPPSTAVPATPLCARASRGPCRPRCASHLWAV